MSMSDHSLNISDIQNLLTSISKQMHHSQTDVLLSFDQYLHRLAMQPELYLRNIFQLFFDMVHYYVPEGEDEYPITPDSIGFLRYDMSRLFIENCKEPFFADRIFANRFMSIIQSFPKSIHNNQIYFFEGPPGSGKSTFLNNLLQKFEEYTQTPEGIFFKIVWYITENSQENNNQQKPIIISCPANDHPITIIPLHFRRQILEKILPENFRKKVFDSKEYEWVLHDQPCAFCRTMYSHLTLYHPQDKNIFDYIRAKRMNFSRHMGKGVSVFNPADPVMEGAVENPEIQQTINRIFKSDDILYTYSYLAYTNNGVMALMDIKDNNVKRLLNLHGIISDGVHKVNQTEERLKTIFLGVLNPEDRQAFEHIQSFRDRIVTIKIPYVLDYNTEVSIWEEKFGQHTIDAFMPRVVHNLAKIFISTRMKADTKVFDSWLEKPEKYKNYIDEHLFLLKMELYTGKIPRWLDDQDVINFKKEIRKQVLSDTETEGQSGISGRQSLNLFNRFISRFELKKQSITMLDVMEFIKNESAFNNQITQKFAQTLFTLYEFNILDEVKEAMYFFNEEKMKRDIKNYLFALNFDAGQLVHCPYTGDTFEVNDEFFQSIEPFLLEDTSSHYECEIFRKQEHITYISKTLSVEMQIQGKSIEETSQFELLMNKYINNLKKSSIAPYENNDHFRRCVEAFLTPEFVKFEPHIQETVQRIILNLNLKFGYIDTSARYIILYVLDNKLNDRFKNFGK